METKRSTSSAANAAENRGNPTAFSKEDIKAAFEFLDIEKTGQVSLSDLKKRLGIFFPEMTSKEFRFLMNNRKEITLDDLNEFLSDSTSTVDGEFDPIAEAFKVTDAELPYFACVCCSCLDCVPAVLSIIEPRHLSPMSAIRYPLSAMIPILQAYDLKGHGYIKKERLKEIFESYGIGMNSSALRDEDLNAIVHLADADGDGKITLEDFRAIVAKQQEINGKREADAVVAKQQEINGKKEAAAAQSQTQTQSQADQSV
jgi:Ca2+-binding EF-hand superfamily protein